MYRRRAAVPIPLPGLDQCLLRGSSQVPPTAAHKGSCRPCLSNPTLLPHFCRPQVEGLLEPYFLQVRVCCGSLFAVALCFAVALQLVG